MISHEKDGQSLRTGSVFSYFSFYAIVSLLKTEGDVIMEFLQLAKERYSMRKFSDRKTGFNPGSRKNRSYCCELSAPADSCH